jgi:hypothetical protein
LYSFTNQHIYNKKQNMKRVVRLTERDLSRIVKRVILEMEGEDMMDGEMEEGLFGPSKAEREEMEKDLRNKMEKLVGEKPFTLDDMANSIDSIIKKAKDTNYKGKVSITRTSQGKPMFAWKPEYTWYQKMAMGTGSQTLGT